MPTRRTFKLAMVQMLVEPGNPAANLRRAAALIAQAARHGAHVIVLPEAMDLGWTHPSATTLAQPVPDGQTCAAIKDAARQHHVYLCAGLTERDGHAVYNSAVLIDPAGSVILHHRKLNELQIAHDLYAQGDRLHVAKTELGAFGVMICADAFAPGQIVSRTLGLMGASVILSPCAWAVEPDHDQQKDPYGRLWLDNYQPVARDFHLFIAGVSNVGPITAGPWKGRHCIGCSLLVGPDGNQILMAPYGRDAETILYADITPPPRDPRHHNSSINSAYSRCE